MSRLIAVCKSLIGSVGSKIAEYNLFIPSGSDSLITSDGKTFKVK